MAVAYNVQGPCKLQISADGEAGTPTWSDFGFSTNDDLFAISVQNRNEILTATDTGEEPAEIVHVGGLAIVSGTLSKWDNAAGNPMNLLSMPGSAAEGRAGVIGSVWVTGSAIFGIRILPLTTGEVSYTFPRCFIDGEGVRIFDHGNRQLKLGFQFIAFRSGTTDTLGDGSSATATFYTRAAT